MQSSNRLNVLGVAGQKSPYLSVVSPDEKVERVDKKKSFIGYYNSL